MAIFLAVSVKNSLPGVKVVRTLYWSTSSNSGFARGDSFGGQYQNFQGFSLGSAVSPILSYRHSPFFSPRPTCHFIFSFIHSFISYQLSPHSWVRKLVGLAHHTGWCGSMQGVHHMLLHWILTLSEHSLVQNWPGMTNHHFSAQGRTQYWQMSRGILLLAQAWHRRVASISYILHIEVNNIYRGEPSRARLLTALTVDDS